ncbi:MAG: hypothetical protein HY266_09800 [Deltaproteobacteria bacterium]|nr:hypothetical protein [Deltaproteobacteria bacterium]
MKKSYLVIILMSLSFFLSCAKVQVEGLPAPDFVSERFNGGSLSLSEFKGRPVILYWFASW